MMMMNEVEFMKGKVVEVMANGITYKGLLTAITEDALSLQTPMQWLEIALDQVIWVKESTA